MGAMVVDSTFRNTARVIEGYVGGLAVIYRILAVADVNVSPRAENYNVRRIADHAETAPASDMTLFSG